MLTNLNANDSFARTHSIKTSTARRVRKPYVVERSIPSRCHENPGSQSSFGQFVRILTDGMLFYPDGSVFSQAFDHSTEPGISKQDEPHISKLPTKSEIK
jgi:hypothetical protein